MNIWQETIGDKPEETSLQNNTTRVLKDFDIQKKKIEAESIEERELKAYWNTLSKEEKSAINEQAKEESIAIHGKRFGALELSVKLSKLELLKKHKLSK